MATKTYTLAKALNLYGSKRKLAELCNISPAAVTKAFSGHESGDEVWRFRVIDDVEFYLERRQAPWRPVQGK